MVTIAGSAMEFDWIVAHVAESGVQVKVAACCGVSFGASSGLTVHSGSIAPSRILSPVDRTWMVGTFPANEISIFQEVPAASRQRNVGGVIPGGKMEPSSG